MPGARTAAMRLSDFEYELPSELVARRPGAVRDRSRLLGLDGRSGVITHDVFADLPRFLRPGDALVLNETRVRRARLSARRASGGRIEILVLDAHPGGGYEAMARPARRLSPGEALDLPGGARAHVEARLAGGRLRLVFADARGAPIDPDTIGEMPIPPYLGREPDMADRDRYQTVYAREPGAVAAPTAGLHFTPGLLEAIEAMGVAIARIVLHVGPGTFRPVTESDPTRHVMEPERYRYPAPAARTIEAARARGGRIVAVGTTTARVLETVGRGAVPHDGTTDLFLHEPHRFEALDMLVTNFHLPRSTLLMLVCALGGRARVLAAYRAAVAAGYRFYSYGDAMLVHRGTEP